MAEMELKWEGVWIELEVEPAVGLPRLERG